MKPFFAPLFLRTLAALAVAGCSLPLAAQGTQLLSFQGRIATGGMNFDGGGLFKFALVNSDGTTTYWSNDGSSSGGSQPTNAVPLTVSKGLYAVMLGDTSLPQMTAIPASAFANADLRLRVWFSDGTHGSQLLRPDERLAGVGYAFLAGSAQTVMDGAVTGAKIAAGAVGSAQLSPSLSIAGSFTLGGTLALPASSSNSVGALTLGGAPFLSAFGSLNTFVGANAGNFTMTGTANTAEGYQALFANTTGGNNTAVGQSALGANTSGSNNAAVGTAAMYNSTAGSNNTGLGFEALLRNSTGDENTAVGSGALQSNTTGQLNTADGYLALSSNSTGVNNVGIGTQVLFANTTGNDNVAVGAGALYVSTTGNNNSALGNSALSHNTSGTNNTALGYDALNGNTTGSNNIALGAFAAGSLTTGSNNIDIGTPGSATDAGALRIGSSGVQTTAFIAGIRGVTTGVNNAQTVVIDGNGQLGTISSSRRYKEEIADMGEASARLRALRPVTFRYKKPYDNGEMPIQFGLIAEEVAEVFPELAVFNADGLPESVKYQDLAPLLLNEVQKLEAERDRLRQENAQIHARLEKLEAGERERTARHEGPRPDHDLEALVTRLSELEALVRASLPPAGSHPPVAGNASANPVKSDN